MIIRMASILRLVIGGIACVAVASAAQAQRKRAIPAIQTLPNCISINQSVTLNLNTGTAGPAPPPGIADPFWRLVSPTSAIVYSTLPEIGGSASSSWIMPSAGANWIQPNASGTAYAFFPAGTYVYRMQFRTPVDPYFYNSITITGNFAADNTAIVRLNGVPIATCSNALTCFNTPTAMTSTPLSYLAFNRVGSAPFLNTLTIEVKNAGNDPSPSGLLVQAQVIAVCSKCTTPAPPAGPPCGGHPSTC